MAGCVGRHPASRGYPHFPSARAGSGPPEVAQLPERLAVSDSACRRSRACLIVASVPVRPSLHRPAHWEVQAMRTGFVGGPLADHLLRRLGERAARKGYCDGSAYRGRSKLEVLFGETFSREARNEERARVGNPVRT